MIPKKVNILGKKYKVKQIYHKKDDKGNYHIGECDYINQLITIDRRIGPAQKMETLIHEMVHAVSSEMGWSSSETTVRTFSVSWYAVMKANSKIFNGRFE